MPHAQPIGRCLDENLVAELVDGRLDAAALAEIDEHLAQCEACRALVGHAGRSTEPARIGRYEVLECVGAGAMGSVYAALDPALDRKIALKLIAAPAASSELEARLLREAKAMARLSHPNVITVHDVGRYGDRLFIAMEFVEGGTLRDWLRAKARTPREIVATYALAGRGLAQAHEVGIVHRDFKPDNVLVGKDGRVRVTDFGLARDQRVAGDADEAEGGSRVDPDAATVEVSLTRTGALVGTPTYMAPEQLAGKEADARSDAYAFAVSLYEALYGERPFEGKTLKELLAAKTKNEVRPAPPGTRVPSRARAVLLRELRADPQERYASMTALVEALDRAMAPRVLPFVAAPAALALGAIALVLAARGARPASAPGPSAASNAIAAPGANACTSNRACVEAHGGAPYVCRGACVPLASEDCEPKSEPDDLSADDTIWLGAMFPMKGPAADAYGRMNVEGANFARQELAAATRPLHGEGASMRVRRVALLACDDSVDSMRAARHLVEDVGAPAILGFGSGQEVVDLAGSLLIRRGVIAVATLTPSPLVTRLPQPAELPHMVWRTTFSLDDLSNATARILGDVLEPRLAARPMRVILAREESASSLSFAEVLHRRLRFNGKAAAENGDAYGEITFPMRGLTRDELARVAEHVGARSPNVVVVLGPSAVTPALVEEIEARTKTRPTYVVAHDSLEGFAAYLGHDVERRRRLFAIHSSSTLPENTRFVLRYNDAHDAGVPLTINPGVTYDAFYLLAYATYALGDRPASGPALARAIGRLVHPGERIEVGPTQVFDALRALAAGKSIDLEGAASGLDFDLATGEAPSDFALLCAGVGADGRASGADVESGVVFRARTQSIVGTPRCP